MKKYSARNTCVALHYLHNVALVMGSNAVLGLDNVLKLWKHLLASGYFYCHYNIMGINVTLGINMVNQS